MGFTVESSQTQSKTFHISKVIECMGMMLRMTSAEHVAPGTEL
jgi:hypothetical protein